MAAGSDPFDIDNFSWPREGARLFEAERPISPPAFLEAGPSRWWMYAQSYRFAAETLVARFVETGHDQDFIAVPVLFLYRHYAEIALKLLERDASLHLGDAEPPLKGHGLRSRWDRVQPLLERIWPDNDDYKHTNAHVRSLILQLDAVDPTSDTFRYPVTPDGAPNLPRALERLDLAHFAVEMTAFAHWVGGVADAIWARQEAADEMRREYEPGPGDY
jgi:hypothetical protein